MEGHPPTSSTSSWHVDGGVKSKLMVISRCCDGILKHAVAPSTAFGGGPDEEGLSVWVRDLNSGIASGGSFTLGGEGAWATGCVIDRSGSVDKMRFFGKGMREDSAACEKGDSAVRLPVAASSVARIDVRQVRFGDRGEQRGAMLALRRCGHQPTSDDRRRRSLCWTWSRV